MFKFSDKLCYQMPAHFGGYEGPAPATYDDITQIFITYETDPEMLAQHVPEKFKILRPEVEFVYQRSCGVQWMGGADYNFVALSVPVNYTCSSESLEGGYALILWENKTDPIIGGRETSGLPKLYADIPNHRQLGERVYSNASCDGFDFLRFEFQKTKKMTAEQLAAFNQENGRSNTFGWRYVPNIGRPGAALSYPTLYPAEFSYAEAWLGEGRIFWESLAYEQNPLQFAIINALGRLPIKVYRGCTMVRGSAIARLDLGRELI